MAVVEIVSVDRVSLRARVRAHMAIMRLDHSIKNLFVLPGIVVPLSFLPGHLDRRFLFRVALAMLSVTLVGCSNYVINEVLDAPFDRLDPSKRNKPAAVGLVVTPIAYLQWLALMATGVGLGQLISPRFALADVALWIMGCVYNLPPLRTKDVAYLDVLTDAVNNPLRMLLGWYAVTSALVPPISLLLSYWMISCYFMALKRFSELSETRNRTLGGANRAPLFRHYTPESLLVTALFYASTAMLFFGAFTIRYRIELILAYPLMALTMAVYCRLSFKAGPAVENPEKLYREPLLMTSLSAAALVLVVLLFVRIPLLERFFMPTLPQSGISAVIPPVRGL